ncbi:hypothetical protein J2W25_001603 [Variovorax boronicumulans]|uniref:DUF4398 domain-containing protein n=1 Tax=Variovorax boronicumulans TaxID=436515 RepID=A0AAW8DT12_9BURK|nr:hypothetical protein [Variovorax boronicumulans]MDP9877296.1 hypothetical protein [Variovorax boronicumulans]MDP9922582.1 hypothetical protein [Variovorax boronicumulans]
MDTANFLQAIELQNESAHAYLLARTAYEAGKTESDFRTVIVMQQDAAHLYRNAAAAREAATGI